MVSRDDDALDARPPRLSDLNDVTIEGVAIPFASPQLLWRTKQTVRDKDRQDRVFLQSILSSDETG